jgi:uncharacterized membrane protein
MGYKRMILLCLLLIMGLNINAMAQETEYNQPNIVEGQVISVIKDEVTIHETSGGDYRLRQQLLKVKILEGEYKNQLMEVYNNIDEMLAINIIIEEGDRVLLAIFDDAYGFEVQIYDLKRDNALYWLTGIFIVFMLVIGRFKGLKSLVSLLITLYAIIGIFLPRVLKGDPPLLLASVIAIIVTFISIALISGINRKSVAAIIGTSIGVICAGLLALFFGKMAHLSGVSTSEAQMLMYIPQGVDFDFTGLLFAGILLGTLGAVMDVCMSIASSITEIFEANPKLSMKNLFVSGMNIGKDVMGTMSNTLILAYVGSSLHLMLLFLAYEMPFKELANNDLIATEIVRSLTGTIGLILSVPITAFVAAFLVKKTKHRQETYEINEE